MSVFTARSRWRSAVLAASLCLGLIAPLASARASTDFSPGDLAVIARANGAVVRLLTAPDAAAAIVADFPEGTQVEIVEGPVPADDGSLWFRVNVGDVAGYMPADVLWRQGEDLAAEATPAAPAETPAEAPEATETATATPEPTETATSGATPGTPSPMPTAETPTATPSPTATVTPASMPAAAKTVVAAESSTTTGKIVNTDGDGARCRSKASTDGSTITVLAEGSSVPVRGAKTGDWTPVVCANRNGYVWAAFVETAASGGGLSGTPTSTTGDLRVIANTGGMGVRCRKQASYDGEVIAVLAEGTRVTLRGAVKGVWQPVVCNGAKGYVHKDYLTKPAKATPTKTPKPTKTPTNTPTLKPTTSLRSGDVAEVAGTNGDGVRFRSGPSSSASVIDVLAEGTRVDVTKGSTGDWVAVAYRGSTGFIHADYLTKAPPPPPSDGSGGNLGRGDHARVTTALNFRSDATTSATVIGVAIAGIVVEITGGKTNGFFPVRWGDQGGYMHGDYLEWTDEEVSPGFGGTGGVSGDPGGAPGSATGNAIVDYAMHYLGYPYVWATHGPDSFDCSGFTYWVVKNVLQRDIGAGLETQIAAGKPVAYGSLQPGDLVFFQNTYKWGLSHVGIYIGNGKFINAENEETGVRISDITSTYYSSRWYGAVRLT